MALSRTKTFEQSQTLQCCCFLCVASWTATFANLSVEPVARHLVHSHLCCCPPAQHLRPDVSGPPSPSPARTGPKAAGINDAFGWHADAGDCPQNEIADGESVPLSRTCRPKKLQPARRGTGESRTRALVTPMPRTGALSLCMPVVASWYLNFSIAPTLSEHLAREQTSVEELTSQ